MSEPSEHLVELRRLAGAAAGVALLAAATYAVPAAADLRPWVPGEPVPLLHFVARPTGQELRLDAFGELSIVDAAPPEAAPDVPPPLAVAEQPAPAPFPLPRRPPALATEVRFPAALQTWFGALADVEAGQPERVVRALHWGDSTIAADGIAGTVRSRLQVRFGDGGPGFVAVHTDPRWQIRPGILRAPKGAWESVTITFGGAPEARYGLAGNVSTAAADEESTASLGGLKIDGQRQPLHRFDVYYQQQPGGGTFSVAPSGHRGAVLPTARDKHIDRFRELLAPDGASSLWLKTRGDGPVTIYGVALETAGPGVTWETLGVAGSSIGSMTAYQTKWHMKQQVERRAPDLLVYQTGGNELTYPSLLKGEGEDYEEAYVRVLEKLRAGAPEASCLLVGPLDQATRKRGQVVSKENLDRMIAVQIRIAKRAGCAFWDARAVMGGAGGFKRWLDHQPRYAWTDLIHLNSEGLELVGDSLADALLAAYDRWRLQNPDAGWQPSDVEDENSHPSQAPIEEVEAMGPP